MTAFALTGALILYVSGHAQLAGANYEKVRLIEQERALKAQRELLNAALLEGQNKDRIEAWAKANGMARAETAPVILGIKR
jgi:hypothetical protein